MNEEIIDEILQDIEKFCLLHGADSAEFKFKIYFKINLIIKNYEKSERKMVLRGEDDQDTIF